jgi:hypothetical protein
VWFANWFQAPSPPLDIAWRRRAPLVYPVLSFVLPLLVLGVGLWIASGLVSGRYIELLSRQLFPLAAEVKQDCKLPPPTVEGLAWPKVSPVALPIKDLSGRLRFAAAYTLLIFTGYLVMALAVAVAFGLFYEHGGVEPAIAKFVAFVFLFAALAAPFFWRGVPGVKLGDFYNYVVPQILCTSNYAQERVWELNRQIEIRGRYGTYVGIAASACVIAVAAILAYRWRSPAWSQPRALRRQLNALLLLFAAASVLLVLSNAAIRALLEWPGSLVPVGDPKTTLNLFEPVLAAGTALSYLWSVLSAAVLLATFIPAFASLLSDIDLAALANLRANPPHAGWPSGEPTAMDIGDWRERNGLALSIGQISTAVLATAAPLLTAPAIDLTKSFLVPKIVGW